MSPRSRRMYPLYLLCGFLVFAGLWAINPTDRHDWMLENALTVLGLGVLIASYRRLSLSNISYTLILIFLCLHTVGSHYTYSLVPYDKWVKTVTGLSLNHMMGWERNHYDRLVHFSFGLLLAYPIREVFIRIAGVRGFWGYYLPLDLTMSFSMLYELIEWWAAEVFGGSLGVAFVGAQGDVWDAHKDMALATLGALITMCVVAAINVTFQKNFGAEMLDSLSVKQPEPLGEVALRKLQQ